jgi:hypothetical protein
MTRDAGVRTVTVGRRPMAVPIQAIGETKGGIVVSFDVLATATTFTLTAANTTSITSSSSATDGKQTIVTVSVPSTNISLPLNLLPGAVDPPLAIDFANSEVNWPNVYPQARQQGPPLQFVYEAANCRIFYKAAYLTDITAVWRDVVDIAWKDAVCVNGSTVNANSTMGKAAPVSMDAVIGKQRVYDGAGSLTNSFMAGAGNKSDGHGCQCDDDGD